MRSLCVLLIMVLGGSALLFTNDDVLGQGGGKRGDFGSKRMGGGGFSFNPLEWLAKDPARSFDFMSRGRGYVLISEVRSSAVRDALTEYAQKKGLGNGQLNRDQFIDFGQDVKTRLDNGTLHAVTINIPPRGDDPGRPASKEGGNVNSADALRKLAEEEFKRRDANGDGFLNKDEMPDALKSELAKWDKNGDGLISQEEFRDYFIARVHGTQADNEKTPSNPLVIILDLEELDKRPTLLRAGKLPKELPPWFKQLDTDGDGQVALWEWRKGGKALDEFAEWDRDGDGFITAEEVLHKLNQERTASNKSANPDSSPEPNAPAAARNGPPRIDFGGITFSRGNGERPNGERPNGDRPNGKGKNGKYRQPD